jgi:uncharacterized GH25 family protein
MSKLFIGFLSFLITSIATAHDNWVETNTSLVRLGDLVHVDLKLGNHGNDHRDFKLSGKVSLESGPISVISPTGEVFDLKPHLVETGLSTKEGYWTGRYTTTTPGLHVVASTSDGVRGTTRSIKSAKTYFLASEKLDDVPVVQSGLNKPLGHALELIPVTNPVTEAGPGQPITVKVLLNSKPLKSARVSFIPRGAVLAEGFDKNFEDETNADGIAKFTPKEGNVVLAVVHHVASDQKGDGYNDTKYSATLTVIVPQIRPNSVKALTSR